jgi:hypothetical protein
LSGHIVVSAYPRIGRKEDGASDRAFASHSNSEARLFLNEIGSPLHGPSANWSEGRRTLIVMGLFGAALLYGDGIITPAISVLSALEGLNVATDVFKPHVVSIAVAILFGLFAIQSRGTAQIAKAFALRWALPAFPAIPR